MEQHCSSGDPTEGGPTAPVVEDTMWNATNIPLIVAAVVVAIGPVVLMTGHSIKYGHIASPADVPTSDE